MAKPMVVIDPCAPEGTPTELAATPDNSFHSAIADSLTIKAPKASGLELQRVFAAALTEVVQQSAWTQHVVAGTRYRAGQLPSLLGLVITNEKHFVDQRIINAPLRHSEHYVLTFDFICYRARNSEPRTWIRNFCHAGMRIFLEQIKLGPASVEDIQDHCPES
ncbi:hypothetical protein CLF_101871 [Clonorchis sinensis]|uniref:Uncharacterized protein n=1 Tax=Clonorchis sinensis TaxID=79923 RepID=G7Y6R4_CLOSI|nr:hypothetical protein CLF_101871 [Clonorchis sinensis]